MKNIRKVTFASWIYYLVLAFTMIGCCDGRCKDRFASFWDSPESDKPCNGVCMKQQRYGGYDNYVVMSSDATSCSRCITSDGNPTSSRQSTDINTSLYAQNVTKMNIFAKKTICVRNLKLLVMKVVPHIFMQC